MSRVGPFRWRPSTDHWSWSPAMFTMLGYAPGDVTPTRSLTMAHVHPDDRPAVEENVAAAVQRLDAFTSAHRVVTVTDTVRDVLVVGYARRRGTDDRGRPDTVLRGWVVDRTGVHDDAAPEVGDDDPGLRRAVEITARVLDTDVGTASALVAHVAAESSPSAVTDRVVASHPAPDQPGLAELLRALEPRPEP